MVGKEELQVEKWTHKEVEAKIALAYQSLKVTQSHGNRPVMSIPVSVHEYTAILSKVQTQFTEDYSDFTFSLLGSRVNE